MNFDRIYDTKILSDDSLVSDPDISSNLHLGELYSALKSKSNLKIKIPEEYPNLAEGGVCHNAGYDAFMTGCCFAFLNEQADGEDEEITQKNLNIITWYKDPIFRIDFSKPKEDPIINHKVHL